MWKTACCFWACKSLFSVKACHRRLAFPVSAMPYIFLLRRCDCDLFLSTLSVGLATHSKECWCHCSPSHPHSGGETICAPSAHQNPAGTFWSTGGHFRQQSLVVPTQQSPFNKDLIKPDNMPWDCFSVLFLTSLLLNGNCGN